jgi:hypothetical protein
VTGFLDFQAIKERIGMNQAISLLNLKVKGEGLQLRAPCPYCKTGGDRALSMNVRKNIFRCFADGKAAGDQIALVAHIRGTSQREAAEYLNEHFPAENSPRHGREGSRGVSTTDALASLGSEEFEDFNLTLQARFEELERRVTALEENKVIKLRRP